MKKLILIFIALLVGCSDTTVDTNTIETVTIGLSHRTYEYAEVFSNDGTFYKMYHTVSGSLFDTIYVDVPAVDTVTLKIHNVLGDVNETYNILSIAVVPDSVYRLKY